MIVSNANEPQINVDTKPPGHSSADPREASTTGNMAVPAKPRKPRADLMDQMANGWQTGPIYPATGGQ